MITLICFILLLIGSANWFCIGVLQYDFVAGLFGSQANVFSRIIYAIIGVSAIWITISLIKGKGKLKFNIKDTFKKKKKQEDIEVKADETNNNQSNNQPIPNYQTPPQNPYQTPQAFIIPPNGYIANPYNPQINQPNQNNPTGFDPNSGGNENKK